CDSDDATTIAFSQLELIFRKIGTRNEVVDQAQKFMGRLVIDLVDVDHNRDSRLFCPSRSLERGDGIASIKVKHSRIDDPLAAHLLNRVLQGRVASPQNRPLADTLFEDDDRDLTRCSFDLANMEFEIFLPQAVELSLAPVISTDGADI